MSAATPNVAASVRARLLNVAKAQGVEFARLKATQKQVDDQPAQGNKVVPFRPVSKS